MKVAIVAALTCALQVAAQPADPLPPIEPLDVKPNPVAAPSASAPMSEAGVDELTQRALAAEAALDYDEAARLWLELLARRELPPHRARDAHIHVGTMFLVVGDRAGARAHFRAVLEREPELDLPPATPSKVRVLFEDTRQEVRAQRERASVGLWIAEGVALTGFVIATVAAAGLFQAAAAEEGAASQEPIQTLRNTHYDRRDSAIYAGDATALGAVALASVAGVVAVLLLAPPSDP